MPASAPPPLKIPDARERIRAAGKRIAVLDDDPTGSQAVHGVAIVTALDDDTLQAAPRETTFFLTNTRSLPEPQAAELTYEVARKLLQADPELELVSRSDSTLRGHVVAEVRAVERARREVAGSGYDGVLLVPAYFEAGRFTSGDVHWARVGDEVVPVGETEFARDATFGYSASNLREFVAEKGGERTASLSLEDIREGGPDRVAALLGAIDDGRWIVVNALDYSDLEVVVLGLQASRRRFVHRTGPSFVRALAGIEPKAPLTAQDIWPDGRPDGHGLIVVGSHVGLTSRQVAAAQAMGGLHEVELDVRELDVAGTSRRVRAALDDGDVLLYTSRALLRGEDADDSLAIARRVSKAVTEVVHAAIEARPAWVLAKGGITSHDVAVHGLGIRRAEVLGQLFDGIVSVFRPLDATVSAVVGTPYVVFAGNVGDEQTLAEIVERFRA